MLKDEGSVAKAREARKDGSVSLVSDGENKELVLSALPDSEKEKTVAWRCAARASTDPPQECDWPICGCDPHANKVLDVGLKRRRHQLTCAMCGSFLALVREGATTTVCKRCGTIVSL